jgi:hypothetical protein
LPLPTTITRPGRAAITIQQPVRHNEVPQGIDDELLLDHIQYQHVGVCFA